MNNLFVYEKLNTSLLVVSAKSSILNVWLDSGYLSASFTPITFYIILGKQVSVEKIGRLREWIFANVWWNFEEQIIGFTRKKYIISLNKKIKRLKFLFTSRFKKVSLSSVKSMKFK